MTHDPKDFIWDDNVEKLLRRAYRPEPADADFARGLEDKLVAAARARSEHRSARRDAQRSELARGRRGHWGWWVGAAAAALAFAAGLQLTDRRDRSPEPEEAPRAAVPDQPDVLQPPAAPQHTVRDPLAIPMPQATLSPRGGQRPRPRPAIAAAPVLAAGESLRTATGERRRATLPDGSVLYLNGETEVEVTAVRRVRLLRGELFVEVTPSAPGDPAFAVETPDGDVTALGTKFGVRRAADRTEVLVTQGRVRVPGYADVLYAGEQLAVGDAQPRPAPRVSHALAWTRELIAAAESPLVPGSEHRGGALIAVEPSGQEMRLSLRKLHVDVHIEDGFARTTIDQTYFNHATWRMEGTFYFPLPPDASLSRLAMYVNGTLMEGGMAERGHARNVYEKIVHTKKDPALLEWVDGSTFKMRVFPLEGRREKRIVLSYTQRLGAEYGEMSYRFPAGHNLGVVRDWSFRARLRGQADAQWDCSSHELKAKTTARDLVLTGSERGIIPDRDVTLQLYLNAPDDAEPSMTQWSSVRHEEARYLMVRHRPRLAAPARRTQRDWIFLFESTGDRDPLLARVQVDIIKTLLKNAEHDDRFAILTAGTRVQALTPELQPCTPERVAAAAELLEGVHLVGALDLEQALAATAPLVAAAKNAHLVHLGSGIPVLGEREVDALVKAVPAGATYVGVGVGKRWERTFMRKAAARTGGYTTQINPDEQVGWRSFELMATLNTPRLLEVAVSGAPDEVGFLAFADAVAHGEEVVAVARLKGDVLPKQVVLQGRFRGKPYREEIAVPALAAMTADAHYLPRSWAKLEIDRLVADGAESHKAEIVALSKAMYVMSPFTSLLVLENEQMYAQFNVDRGRKDHWALYPCPAEIEDIYEPLQGVVSAPAAPRSQEAVLQSILIREPYQRYVTANRLLRGGGAFAPQMQRAGPGVDHFFTGGGRVLDGGVIRLRNTVSPELYQTLKGFIQENQLGWGNEVYLGFAGGGLYRGPGNVVPPGAGGGGGSIPLYAWPSVGNTKSGFFFNDGVEGDVRSRSENFFTTTLGAPLVGTIGDIQIGNPLDMVFTDQHLASGPTRFGRPAWRGYGNVPRLRFEPPIDVRQSFGEPITMTGWTASLQLGEIPTQLPSGVIDSFGLEFYRAQVQMARAGISFARRFSGDPDEQPTYFSPWALPNPGQALLYRRPPVRADAAMFADLLRYAPGMNTSRSDLVATLEREAADPAVTPGPIDDRARKLVEAARAHGWQRITRPADGLGEPYDVVFDGAGRFAYRRATAAGLSEEVSCDGDTLWHLYPEIGVGARRVVAAAYRPAFETLVPWALPPVEELARGVAVVSVGDRTVALVPREPADREQIHLRVELVFAADGRLAERRLVQMPDAEVHVRQTYAADGHVRILVREGDDEKVVLEQPLARRADASPAVLPPQTDKLVVLPLPHRTRQHVLEQSESGTRPYSEWSEQDALALIGANLPGAYGEVSGVVQQRFGDDGARPGFWTLAVAAAATTGHIDLNLVTAIAHLDDPLAHYLSEYVQQLPDVLDVGAEPATGTFLAELGELRRVWRTWAGGRAQQLTPAQRVPEIERALRYARTCRSVRFGWAALSIVESHVPQDQRTALADAYARFADEPGLRYVAGYERARVLQKLGRSEAARALLRKLYQETVEAGRLPAIDAGFRTALQAGPEGAARWGAFAREVGERLRKAGDPAALVGFAWQCHQIGDAGIASELLSMALADSGGETGDVSLVALQYLWHTKQWARAATLIGPLMEDERLRESAGLLRLAAEIAEQQGELARALAHLESALDVEYHELPDVVDLAVLRRDYGDLLNRYDKLAKAIVTLDTAAPTTLIARVVRAADRWRSIDPDAAAACQAAARILRLLGQPELAWDYLTTPLADKPGESAPWTKTARELRDRGEHELADRAFQRACELEQTNPDLRWERGQNLLQAGRTEEARAVIQQIADGDWQPRFAGTKQKAQAYVGR